MKFSNLHKRELRRFPIEINLTNLVDITLNLLLAFMLMAGSTSQTPGIEVSLPEAESGVAKDNNNSLVIVISSDQTILVNNKAITKSDLEKKLREFSAAKHSAKNNGQPGGKQQGQVFLEADKLAAHGKVVQILDLIKKSGIGEVAIVTSSKTKN